METTFELKLAVTFHCHETDSGKVRRALLAGAEDGALATVLRNELGADDLRVTGLKVLSTEMMMRDT